MVRWLDSFGYPEMSTHMDRNLMVNYVMVVD
jgi:hypothetical protein